MPMHFALRPICGYSMANNERAICTLNAVSNAGDLDRWISRFARPLVELLTRLKLDLK
jgi:hypothetical protein